MFKFMNYSGISCIWTNCIKPECVNNVTFMLNCVTRKVILSGTFGDTNIKNHNMKKILFFVLALVFVLSSTSAIASKTAESNKPAVPVKTENKLSDAEVDRITKRVKEIRKMDKSDLTGAEKSELKSELKEMKKDVKKNGGTIYIGGATLVLIIILVLLLV